MGRPCTSLRGLTPREFVENTVEIITAVGPKNRVESIGDKATGHYLLYIIISDPVTGNVMKINHGRHDVE